ncbi:MAG: hypothetical protein RR061_09655 [Muribaculaceae bacterium]
MKKLRIIGVLLCTLFAVSCFATKIVATYYGTKLGGSGNNPCKGETTSICATIEAEEVYDESKRTNYVIEIVKDSDGNIVSQNEYAGKLESRITPTTLIRPITPLHQRNQITPMPLVPMIDTANPPSNCIITITTTSE